jgi:predicted small lipoprotein YifL
MHASIRALILIAALAVSLTACGGSSSPAAVVPPVLPTIDTDLDWDNDNWDERNWQ